MALTELQIRNAKAGSKPKRLSDRGGLHLLVDTKGRKYWNWRYRWPPRTSKNKQEEVRLGPYKSDGRRGLSLKEAREQQLYWASVLTSGRRPREVKEQQKGQQFGLQDYSRFEAAAMYWYDRRVRGDWSDRHAKDVLRKLELHILPCLGSLRLDEIRASHGRQLLAPLEEAGKKETASRCLSIASQILDHAAANDWLTANPLSSTKRDLTLRKVKTHYPSLSWRHVPELWQAAENYAEVMDRQTFNALRLQALTFVRPGELIAMRWDEIDWDRKQWLIPAARMKGKKNHNRDHLVPLSQQALAVLRSQQQINGTREYVFFSTRSGKGHISNMTVNMVLIRMGFKGRMCAHGFRAMAMTALQEERQIDRIYIDRQLAHVEKDEVDAAYNRALYINERTALMQTWADMLVKAGMSLPPG
jgi:integrase